MSSLSLDDIKSLNSVKPQYSKQTYTPYQNTDDRVIPELNSKMRNKDVIDNKITYPIIKRLYKETNIGDEMKNFSFILVSYCIEKYAYLPFLLFHVEEKDDVSCFPSMEIDKDAIFNETNITSDTIKSNIMDEILSGTNTRNSDEAINENYKYTDNDGDTFTDELIKSYMKLTGINREQSEINYQGFINVNDAVYVFFENNEMYFKANQWATIDELVEKKTVYNNVVSPIVSNLFINIPETNFLVGQDNYRIEVPAVCYLAAYSENKYSTEYFTEDYSPFSIDVYTVTIDIPLFENVFVFTRSTISDTQIINKAKRYVVFLEKAVHFVEDEITVNDVNVLAQYNMICHEKVDNNIIIIQKDTLFYALPL